MHDPHPRNATEQFVQLVINHQGRLRAFVRSLVPDRSAAADVMQETNLVLWRKASEFEPGSDFAAWMFRIARYQVMAHRQKHRRDRLAFDDALIARLADAAERRSTLHEARQEALARCVQRLPDGQRHLITGRYTQALTPDELAREADRPVGSIRQTLYRIRLALAECVDRSISTEGLA